tara:strand:+ start:295 stop:1005 length:711 start_codon:yes stop_codon:yes gene_type:complete
MSQTIPTFFIGYDPKEDIAYRVCKQSLVNKASIDITVLSLKLYELIAKGIYKRNVDPLASTEFTYTRFFIPYLMNYNGWAVFCDCDFLFLEDIKFLFKDLSNKKAIYCVKHDYSPKEKHKMDGKTQTIYPRKNWSSLIVYNCSHPSNKVLNLDLVNNETGSYLHQFKWLKDSEIGELDMRWNWLEGWTSSIIEESPYAVHFTRGGPWFNEWKDVEFADEWNNERNKYLKNKFNKII